MAFLTPDLVEKAFQISAQMQPTYRYKYGGPILSYQDGGEVSDEDAESAAAADAGLGDPTADTSDTSDAPETGGEGGDGTESITPGAPETGGDGTETLQANLERGRELALEAIEAGKTGRVIGADEITGYVDLVPGEDTLKGTAVQISTPGVTPGGEATGIVSAIPSETPGKSSVVQGDVNADGKVDDLDAIAAGTTPSEINAAFLGSQARRDAYANKQFGLDTGLPESIDIGVAKVPTSVGFFEGIADSIFNPTATVANAIAERGIKSVDGESAEGTPNYNPEGVEVVTAGGPLSEGGRTAAYDPNTNVVYDTNPFGGRVDNIQNLYDTKNAIDASSRDSDGPSPVVEDPLEPEVPECPPGYSYNSLTEQCEYEGQATVAPAPIMPQFSQYAPPMVQYTQSPMFYPGTMVPQPQGGIMSLSPGTSVLGPQPMMGQIR